MKKTPIVSAALSAALLLTLTACQTGGESTSASSNLPAGVAVQVTQVVRDTISTQNKVSGRVVSLYSSMLRFAFAFVLDISRPAP